MRYFRGNRQDIAEKGVNRQDMTENGNILYLHRLTTRRFVRYVKKGLTGLTTSDILSLVFITLWEVMIRVLSKLRDRGNLRPFREKDDKSDKEDDKDQRKKYPVRQNTDFPVRVFPAKFFKSISSDQKQEL